MFGRLLRFYLFFSRELYWVRIIFVLGFVLLRVKYRNDLRGILGIFIYCTN